MNEALKPSVEPRSRAVWRKCEPYSSLFDCRCLRGLASRVPDGGIPGVVDSAAFHCGSGSTSHATSSQFPDCVALGSDNAEQRRQVTGSADAARACSACDGDERT